MPLGDYPRGQVTFDGAALFQCDSFDYTHTNNGKLKSTLRADPAGTVRGARAVSFNFKVWMPDDPAEADNIDWQTSVQFKLPHVIYLKLPGGQRVMLDCILTEEGANITVEDGVKKAVKGVGFFVSLYQQVL